MTHKRKAETFSKKIEHSGSEIFLSLTPVFRFVFFHLKAWQSCLIKSVVRWHWHMWKVMQSVYSSKFLGFEANEGVFDT